MERLIPLVYQDLRRMARRQMRGEHPNRTLQTTALINEAYLRLAGAKSVRWQDRIHFFAIAAQIMRRVLVDAARARATGRRGTGMVQVELHEAIETLPNRGRDLVALDEALDALAQLDPRKGRVVELRFFGGLETEEIAQVLAVSPRTVLRDWNLARAWLIRNLAR